MSSWIGLKQKRLARQNSYVTGLVTQMYVINLSIVVNNVIEI